jgi:hypothetical protein
MEQKELVVQNLDLVNEVIYYRVKRNPGNPDHDMEDLEQIGRLGLCLDGLSGSEIAKLYHVKPNHVSAWISRAQQRLLQDQTLLKLVS